MKTLKSLIGIFILLFIAIGAVLGVLFAPEKGPSIRKEIADQKNFYMNELSEKFSALINRIFLRFDISKFESDQINRMK